MRSFFCSLFFIGLAFNASGQNIIGKWKTIDDKSGKFRSVIEVSERNGKIIGKVVQMFLEPHEPKDPVCEECDEEDVRYKRRILGMEVLEAKKEGNEIKGEILDPENGNVYRCKMWLEGKELKLRGYLGPFFRTQTWVRE